MQPIAALGGMLDEVLRAQPVQPSQPLSPAQARPEPGEPVAPVVAGGGLPLPDAVAPRSALAELMDMPGFPALAMPGDGAGLVAAAAASRADGQSLSALASMPSLSALPPAEPANTAFAEALRQLTMASSQRMAAALPDGGSPAPSSIAPGAATAAAAAAVTVAQLPGLDSRAVRDSVLLPTQVNPLQTGPTRFGQVLHLNEQEAARRKQRASSRTRKDDRHDGDRQHGRHDDQPTGEFEDGPVQGELARAPSAAVPAAPIAKDSAQLYRRLTASLALAGQHAALRELELGRRVLLLMPTHGEPTRAHVHLLGLDRVCVGRVQEFAARWSPGSLATLDKRWRHWRVHQETSRGRWPVLQSSPSARSGGDPACVLRLGTQPATLQDPGTACLDIADGSRFLRALGAQWSVLVVLAMEAG